MSGAGKKLCGYYPTTDTWVPLQVDANGKVVVDMSAINLGDLGDVSVAAPSDDDILYWDAATSLWKARALVDADIPASIARDTEVIAAVAAEAAARAAAIAAIELDDLADLDVASPTDGNVLYWDNAASKWKAKSPIPTKILDADEDTGFEVEQSADEDKIHGKVKGVEVFLLDDAGVLTLAKQSASKGYRATTTQDIPHNVMTKVQYNAEDYDVQSEFDSTTNYRFTAKTPGRYLVILKGEVYPFTDVANNRLTIQIQKNGADAGSAVAAFVGSNWVFGTSVIVVDLAVNDYLEGYLRHREGSTINITVGVGKNYLAVQKLV